MTGGPLQTPRRASARRTWILAGAAGLVSAAVIGIAGAATATSMDRKLDEVESAHRVVLDLSAIRDLASTTRVVTIDLDASEAVGKAGTEFQSRHDDLRQQVQDFVSATPGVAGVDGLESSYMRWYDAEITALTVLVTGQGDRTVATADAAAKFAEFVGRVTALNDAAVQQAHTAVHDAEAGPRQLRAFIYAVVGAMALITLVGATLGGRRAGRRAAVDAEREAEARATARRADLETRLQRGLEMADTEVEANDVVRIALNRAVPYVPVQFLTADSSKSHFRIAATSGPETPGCGVASPGQCPAVRNAQQLIFESSDAVDACPYLRAAYADEPRGAACVPVSIGGVAVGVLHALATAGAAPSADVVNDLSLLARRSGERIGVLRAHEQNRTQATTDVLSGLLNRRAFETEAGKLDRDSEEVTVVFGDLDHFKLLNDTYGHDAGDRALRLFSHVLRASLRPDDVVARYGGEEFVIAMPRCGVDEAVAVVDRLRERLARAVEGGGTPPFTASFGVATWEPEQDLPDALICADRALLEAKQRGRNRVVKSTDVSPTSLTSVPAAD